ncbi:MAG: substrate-binding domain-containing protein [Coriobacteriales bacterium]|nr:substrate-binding domain-containing protein [Coriobacteriales bacterium]
MLLFPAVFFGQVVYALFTPLDVIEGEPDALDYYSLQQRPEAWHRIVDEELFTERDLMVIDGSTATVPIKAELYRQFVETSETELYPESSVVHSTTHSAYLNLIDREEVLGYYAENGKDAVRSAPVISLILVTPPSEDELRHAKDAGVTLDMEPVARDGFVFIVNKENPVDSLTIEQIQGIYSGAITNWEQVGGNNQEIQAFQRNENSGSQTAMEQLVMQGTPMAAPPKVAVIEGMGSLVSRVAEYQNGTGNIGYTYRYYLENLYRNENVKMLRVEGIAPSDVNLQNESYPFTTSYYAIIRDDEPTGSPARRLRDFLLTETGQKIIELAGYCREVQ